MESPPGEGHLPTGPRKLSGLPLLSLAQQNTSAMSGFSSLAPKMKNLIVAGGLTGFVTGVYFYTMRAVGGTDELQMAIDKFEEEKNKVEVDAQNYVGNQLVHHLGQVFWTLGRTHLVRLGYSLALGASHIILSHQDVLFDDQRSPACSSTPTLHSLPQIEQNLWL
ncbi:hypothetical protein EJ110_NYTH06347 [Nymphaea thermarum]|nr:hypothetical protein EJ110_NYTH06347 [Nymphaea thermarum]